MWINHSQKKVESDLQLTLGSMKNVWKCFCPGEGTFHKVKGKQAGIFTVTQQGKSQLSPRARSVPYSVSWGRWNVDRQGSSTFLYFYS